MEKSTAGQVLRKEHARGRIPHSNLSIIGAFRKSEETYFVVIQNYTKSIFINYKILMNDSWIRK